MLKNNNWNLDRFKHKSLIYSLSIVLSMMFSFYLWHLCNSVSVVYLHFVQSHTPHIPSAHSETSLYIHSSMSVLL